MYRTCALHNNHNALRRRRRQQQQQQQQCRSSGQPPQPQFQSTNLSYLDRRRYGIFDKTTVELFANLWRHRPRDGEQQFTACGGGGGGGYYVRLLGCRTTGTTESMFVASRNPFPNDQARKGEFRNGRRWRVCDGGSALPDNERFG
jgi:hypothetical protein